MDEKKSNVIDVTELENTFINLMKRIPLNFLEEFCYTLHYCHLAESLGNDSAKENKLFDERYSKNIELLENDLISAPIILKRLEVILENFPKDSINYQIAQKSIPEIKRFYELLEEYNNPRPMGNWKIS